MRFVPAVGWWDEFTVASKILKNCMSNLQGGPLPVISGVTV